MPDTFAPHAPVITTQDIFNQPEPLVDYNLFATHRALQHALRLNAGTDFDTIIARAMPR